MCFVMPVHEFEQCVWSGGIASVLAHHPVLALRFFPALQTWADTFISELNDTHVEAELRTKNIPPAVSGSGVG